VENITIRNLQLPEMVIPVELALRDNRNPGLTEGEFLFYADNNGFFVALTGNEVFGTIASVKYDKDYGFIGLHFVVEHYRNTGLTEKLLEVALETAGERNIGVNCREEQTELYKNYGFKPAFKIISYEGIADGKYNVPPDISSPFSLPFDELFDYNRNLFPYERKLFFYQWLNQPGSLLFGKYENNKYKGFGLSVPCRKGYRLAPIISDDVRSANEILTALVSHLSEGTPYSIDVPEQNNEGIDMVHELKLEKIGERIRMYKGKDHEIPLKNIYGFINLEVG
jgi:GNAT superfamily N-acetyltransferase